MSCGCQPSPALVPFIEALLRRGYRITSVCRMTGRSTGHTNGTAADVAFIKYRPQMYTEQGARGLLRMLRRVVPNGHAIVVVSEFDHYHVELWSRNQYGILTSNGPLLRQP